MFWTVLVEKIAPYTLRAVVPRQMARQQRAFYLQSERIQNAGGRQCLARHKAGEIALVHQPPTLDSRMKDAQDCLGCCFCRGLKTTQLCIGILYVQ